MPVIPNDLAILISILASAFAHRLRDSNLPKSTNAIIAIGALILMSIAVTWLVIGFTLDIRQDVLLIVGITASILVAIPEFKAFLQIQAETPSPLVQPPTISNNWNKRTGSDDEGGQG